MKYNFTAFFLFICLLHTNNLSAAVRTYSISCNDSEKTTSTIKCTSSMDITKTEYNAGDPEVIPCVCPNDETRVVYYKCESNETLAVWAIKKVPEELIDPLMNTNSNAGGCYACGTGDFLVGTKCYSCKEQTGIKEATTRGDAFAGASSCYIPSLTNSEDEKGTFKYLADCIYTCTNSNDELCKSNA